jgi:predicted RNase H-like nuclease
MSALQQSWNVSGRLENRNDLKRHVIRAISDQIGTELEESDRQIREVLARMTFARHCGEALKSFKELVLKSVGCLGVVLRYEIPNLLEVLERFRRNEVALHAILSAGSMCTQARDRGTRRHPFATIKLFDAATNLRANGLQLFALQSITFLEEA